MTTGEKIKRLRIDRGWTQQELGDRIGVQKAAVNKYEIGSVVNLKQKTLRALSETFGVAGAWLMDDSDWPPMYLNRKEESEEERLLKAFRSADPTYKAVALELLESHPIK